MKKILRYTITIVTFCFLLLAGYIIWEVYFHQKGMLSPPGHTYVNLKYIGDEDSWYVIEVTDAYERPKHHPSALNISNVYLRVRINKTSFVNFSEGEGTDGVLLLQAKNNYQNVSYTGNITYEDKDENQKVSKGDIIRIRREECGGIVRKGYEIGLVNYQIIGFLGSVKLIE